MICHLGITLNVVGLCNIPKYFIFIFKHNKHFKHPLRLGKIISKLLKVTLSTFWSPRANLGGWEHTMLRGLLDAWKLKLITNLGSKPAPFAYSVGDWNSKTSWWLTKHWKWQSLYCLFSGRTITNQNYNHWRWLGQPLPLVQWELHRGKQNETASGTTN